MQPDHTADNRYRNNSGNENFRGNRMYIQLKKFDDLTGSDNQGSGHREMHSSFRLAEMYLIAAKGDT